MLIKLYPENPAPRHLKIITECLMDGGIIIYPTDTVYGFGCSIRKPKAVERIAKMKGFDMRHHNFSIICSDLSQLSEFVRPIPNHIFRILKKSLPGPYTFILEANHNVPKLIHRKKKQVGIRIPDNNIAREIVNYLGDPLLSSSVLHDDEILEYRTDPELIYERYKNDVDIVIDGGYGDNNPSTIIDCTGNDIEVIREGKGDISFL
jgi:tRNA threonylcarbamoyl adenosine modification protein (Sua5/YciO/YrdC/YwlC family)